MEKSAAMLKRLFKIICVKWQSICLFSIFCGIVSYFGMYLIMPPTYTAMATIYINNSLEQNVGKKNITQSDLVVSEYLIPTYVRMLSSTVALEDVIQRSNLSDYEASDLTSAVTVETISGTAILKIYVNDKNSENAAILANSVVDTLSDFVAKKIGGSSVKVIDLATPTRVPSNEMGYVNGFVGMFCGVFISMFFFYIRYMQNAYIVTAEDIKDVLGMPLLGSVPHISDDEENSRE